MVYVSTLDTDASRSDNLAFCKVIHFAERYSVEGGCLMSLIELADAPAKAPAVDFMALLGRCLGNFKMLERVLKAFSESGLADLRQLHEAIETADLKCAAEISHRFKGSAGNVSATQLHKLAMQSEEFSREGNQGKLRTVFEQLEIEWADFERFAQVFVPANSINSRVPAGQ